VRNTRGVTIPAGFTPFLGARAQAAFGHPEDQVIPPNAWTALRWHRLDEPPLDETAAVFDPARPTRYTAPLSGTYQALFAFTMRDRDEGALALSPGVNGVPTVTNWRGFERPWQEERDPQFAQYAEVVPVAWSGVVALAVGDVYEALVRHTFTEDLVLAPGSAHMIVHYLGAT
jgi:hypothetical protein